MKTISAFALAAFVLSAGPLWAELRISEICPEPAETVDVKSWLKGIKPGQWLITKGHEPIPDPNGKESGWIELINTGSERVNLSNYKISCKKRGKDLKLTGKKPIGNLASRWLDPGKRTLVYIGEQYDNAEDMGGDGKTVKIYPNDVMAVPVSAKPKSFPIAVLAKADGTIIDRFIIPVDLPPGCSFAPGTSSESYDANDITRSILPTPTPGKPNNYSGAIAYGPNAGPLYGVDFKKITPEPTDLKPNPPAKLNTDYLVSMPVNPLSDRPANAIASVKLVYRVMKDKPGVKPDYKEITYNEGEVPMTKRPQPEKGNGDIWEGTIPGSALTQHGMVVQWAFQITDGADRTWRSPSFHDPDNSYEWYGTMIEPTTEQTSTTLQTMHLFAEERMLTPDPVIGNWADNPKGLHSPIDRQHEYVESKEHLNLPYGARCSIYDEQTSNYYDNVKIDLRGNTTAALPKRSHGIRFNKCHPLTCTNTFTGELIDEIRKTSFIAEQCDPTAIRQILSFYVRRQCGDPTPFSYPVLLTMNGKFFQLANHSNRFTDELIADYYGFEEGNGSIGYTYKNVGQLDVLDVSGPGRGVAGGAEKKTPDNGGEYDLEQVQAFAGKISKAVQESGHDIHDAIENEHLTKEVVRSFNLSAWINFLASARITQEADDTWANLCLYCDSIHTGTWMPLGYDQNLSFGQYYPEGVVSKWKVAPEGAKGTIADWDNHKSHPFYGGWKVKHQSGGLSNYQEKGNHGYEAIYQSPKIRHLYLRRLRTLMDQVLKAPGTAQADTPFWRDIVVPMKEAMASAAAKDDQTWGDGFGETIYEWENRLSYEDSYTDLWANYIVKRREHLFNTHSVHNTTKGIGYDWQLSAGIPDAQSPVGALKNQFSISVKDIGAQKAIVIANGNNEAVDMSGWKLEGPWDKDSWSFLPGELKKSKKDEKWMKRCTLPPGTVVDANDVLYIAFDRKALVAELETSGTLKDQVIIGNVPAPKQGLQSLLTLTANDDLHTLVAQEESAGGPTVIPTPDDQNGAAAIAEAAMEPSVKSWLTGIAQRTGGADAIKAFTGTADDVQVCKFLDKLPVAGAAAALELTISNISIDANGNIKLDAEMKYGQTPVSNPVNGKIVILEYDDLTKAPVKTTELSGNTFPVKDATPSGQGARFFRIGLQN